MAVSKTALPGSNPGGPAPISLSNLINSRTPYNPIILNCFPILDRILLAHLCASSKRRTSYTFCVEVNSPTSNLERNSSSKKDAPPPTDPWLRTKQSLWPPLMDCPFLPPKAMGSGPVTLRVLFLRRATLKKSF